MFDCCVVFASLRLYCFRRRTIEQTNKHTQTHTETRIESANSPSFGRSFDCLRRRSRLPMGIEVCQLRRASESGQSNTTNQTNKSNKSNETRSVAKVRSPVWRAISTNLCQFQARTLSLKLATGNSQLETRNSQSQINQSRNSINLRTFGL